MDFLAIGDIVVDTFIRLKEEDARVDCDASGEHCTLAIPFPRKVPFESATVLPGVGNAPNAAVAASRLGVKSAMMTWVGNDANGIACKDLLAKEGVGTELVTVEDGKITANQYVLWYGIDRTILVKHEPFNYTFPMDVPVPRAVYFSSVSESGAGVESHLAEWLESHPDILFTFQPGTLQIETGILPRARLYRRADIFIANKEEYQKLLVTDEEDEKKLMEMMRSYGPKRVFLTDGPLGAYALSDEGACKIGLYPDHREAFERTGAGDAFASIVTVALLEGKSVPEALQWGPVNSMSVVQKIGAQEGLLTRDALLAYLAKVPEYKAELL